MKSRATWLFFLSAAVSGVLSLNAAGQLTPLPYTNTFETNNPGDTIVGLLGWGVADGATTAIVISSSDHTNNFSPYLPANTPHTNVLDIAGTVSNVFVPNTPDFVYIDVCIKPQFRENPPFDQVTPAPQVAVYVNTNGNLVFYHAWWQSDYIAPTWSTNDTIKIASNEWTRLTFELAFNNYTGGGYFGDSFYRVRINGRTDFYTNGLSYSLEDVSGGPEGTPEGVYPTTNRTWFMCANNTSDTANTHKLDSFTVSGFAQMDDFYASTNNAAYQETGSGSYTTNGTPHLWLDSLTNFYGGDYNLADNSDKDADGALNWQEYWAGTDPQNSASFFKVVSVSTNTTSFTVTWMGGTNDVNPYWVIYRTTNLLGNPSVLWTNLPVTNVPRASAVLNSTYSRWVDTNGPAYAPRLFYKLTTTTNAPN